MKLTKQQKQAQEFIQQLIKVCWENPDFKKQLIASPIKTIEKVTGKPNRLPEGIQVEVEDQSNALIIYLNIPARPAGGPANPSSLFRPKFKPRS